MDRGVKGQSNFVIAGSPRNAFRCSVACFVPEVEHWIGDGPPTGLLTLAKLRMPVRESAAVRLWGDKLHSREGNSPEHQLRPPKRVLSGKRMWSC